MTAADLISEVYISNIKGKTPLALQSQYAK